MANESKQAESKQKPGVVAVRLMEAAQLGPDTVTSIAASRDTALELTQAGVMVRKLGRVFLVPHGNIRSLELAE